MTVKRTATLAVLASIGIHAGAVAVLLGSSLWRGWPRGAVDVQIVGMRLEDLQDLPLGAPAAGEDAAAKKKPRPRTRASAQAAADGTVAVPGDKGDKDEGATPAEVDPDGAAPPRPTSVRAYGPEGSRVTALVRIDRLRGTAYQAPLDGVLGSLPDRRDLLEGTGLDLYQDIDALLIATPNPLDPTVTLLAVRHRLGDAAMRTALERGARASGRTLSWRTERGRPFAERRAGRAAPGDGEGGPRPEQEHERARWRGRDHRLLLLPAPHLVVVAPPAYRSLILRGGPAKPRPAATTGAGAPDAGGGAIADGGAAGGDASSVHDGGPAPDGGQGAETGGWAALLRRIDAEDSILPEDAVAMVSAVELFAARSMRGRSLAVPDGRGKVAGMPMPRTLTATLGIEPRPFADVDAEMGSEEDAVRWQEHWPTLQRSLAGNAWVALTGFSALVRRATLSRTGSGVRLRIDATPAETVHLLELLASLLGRSYAPP